MVEKGKEIGPTFFNRSLIAGKTIFNTLRGRHMNHNRPPDGEFRVLRCQKGTRPLAFLRETLPIFTLLQNEPHSCDNLLA